MDIDLETATRTRTSCTTKAEKEKQKAKATKDGVEKGKVAARDGALEVEAQDWEEKDGRRKAKEKATR